MHNKQTYHKMKIALIQQSCSQDISFNIHRGVETAKEAAQQGAKIICFAELAFTPFYPQVPASGNVHNLTETIPGPTTDLFSNLAKELGVIIILNLFEKEGEKTFDTSPVITSDGKLIGKTRMVHITEYEFFHEQGYYSPGDLGAPVYDTEFGKIGIAICYDRHFPEYMRALGIAGAEIVFIPQAGSVGEWPAGLYEAEMQVAAFQNGYFTALCNRVGKEKKLVFSGESFVCSPSGEIIAQAQQGKNEILYCDINLAEVKNSHARKLFFRDRRPQIYSKWLK
jgi:N-carbamoylputrescine amidase